jgi:eukaryotic-like serine/threonine-protein kinase
MDRPTAMNVVDSKNISYEILEKIGEGSQGITYLLKDKKHIAKLFNSQHYDPSLKSKINFLINLGLDKEVFATPLRQITQPKNGYIAEFASGMSPLSSLKPGSECKNFTKWYVESGGLLKRYNALKRLAAVLRSLHSKGLIYCDLSLNNVFISERKDSDKVFLIDLDNLKYKTGILNNIYTPFYGAPEVITNRAPNTPFSDSYSFAVIAYELLTLNHPLIGDYISEGEPELEEQALVGQIPWVDDSKDQINARTTGLPTNKVIPTRLLTLFRKCFEDGLHNPHERPSMAEWFDALNNSLSELLQCGKSKCRLHYPFNNLRECTFCGYRPEKVTRIRMRRWEEVEFFDPITQQVKQQFILQPKAFDEILLDKHTPREISAAQFLMPGSVPSKALLRVEVIDDNREEKVLLSPIEGAVFFVSPRNGLTAGAQSITLDRPRKIRVIDSVEKDKPKLMLHLLDLNTSQRVLTID